MTRQGSPGTPRLYFCSRASPNHCPARGSPCPMTASSKRAEQLFTCAAYPVSATAQNARSRRTTACAPTIAPSISAVVHGPTGRLRERRTRTGWRWSPTAASMPLTPSAERSAGIPMCGWLGIGQAPRTHRSVRDGRGVQIAGVGRSLSSTKALVGGASRTGPHGYVNQRHG